MDDTAKYLIHADVTTDGVVERSDVVGAVFGQTEGLLGDELDIRDLQQSAKLGRIDVEVESEGGRSFGRLTIASNLDRVETAILGAALETIERVGPCRAEIRVADIEDARAAKRRAVVDRAKALLGTAFDEAALSSSELVEEVRESVRVEAITEYEGLPAGPRVAEGDALIVVEGRADVLTLLQYGIKNAVAVEGTDVPDAVAALTRERTTTAFFDGDRGGDLILRELTQVGDVDYVARAPEGRSVEDLTRKEVTAALRGKVDAPTALASLSDAAAGEGAAESADGETSAEEAGPDEAATGEAADGGAVTDGAPAEAPGVVGTAAEASPGAREPATETGAVADMGSATETDTAADTTVDPRTDTEADGPASLAAQAAAVVGSGRVRLLDDALAVVAETDADGAFAAIADADPAPAAVLVDGTVTQRLLDVAAQRGVSRVVGTARGDYVKQPASVRVHTASELRESAR